MNRKKTLDRIAELLARFGAEVKALNKESLYDINIHAENVLVPIINKVYELNVVNANKKEKNAAAIDLIDSKNRICFQVTSTSDSEKIKHTLRQFKKYNKEEFFDTLFIYIITDKQKSYTGKGYDEILDGAIEFDKDDHIIDNTDLFEKINSFYSLPKIKEVLELLELEFSEEKIEARRNRTVEEKIHKTDRIYSNLLELKFPVELYIADLNIERDSIIEESWQTEYKLKRSASERTVVARALVNYELGFFKDYHVYGKKIITFRDLNSLSEPLTNVIDFGTVEIFESEDFYSQSENNQKAFSELLKFCFQEKAIRKGIKYNAKERFFQYLPSKKSVKTPRTITWKIKKSATRNVVTPYFKNDDVKKKEITIVKHLAFSNRVKFLNDVWFVLINPTWSYTRDGYKKSAFHAKNLKGMKSMENNAAVRNTVLAIACHLNGHYPKENKYKYLKVELPNWGELTYEIESK